jgi:epoxyqueuosine reductase
LDFFKNPLMSNAGKKELTDAVKAMAFRQGFDLCGIAPVRNLKEHIPLLKKWCELGMNGQMSYLGRDIERRSDPSYILPGAKSVIVTGLNYYTGKDQKGKGVPIISKYAYGEDYHDIVSVKLDRILEYIISMEKNVVGRSFVDSSPILEKAWAREAGIGWQGRHSVIINNEIGSFFFIGVLLVDIDLEYDTPLIGDQCGECRLCIDTCPTSAINEDRTIDARKCISYLTVEHKGKINENLAEKLGNRVFGCDYCQEVCPWNVDVKQHNIQEFEISLQLEMMTADDWKKLTEEEFNHIFEKSTIRRRKYERFMQNMTNTSGGH